MKKLLGLIGLVAALSSPAHAGVGSTAYLGGTVDGTQWVPSLDIRASGWLVQIHVLDTAVGFATSATPGSFVLNTGADVTKIVAKRKIAAELEGVFMPGGGFRVVNTPGTFGFNVNLEGRLGAELKDSAGIGMYVVPMIGLSNLGGNTGVNYGGSLQVSVWFAK